MDSVVTELFFILLLILANGFFAGAEIAIIAAGRGRLQQQADAGNHGAKLALELAADPNRFLPTVQVGISLIASPVTWPQPSRRCPMSGFPATLKGSRWVSLSSA